MRRISQLAFALSLASLAACAGEDTWVGSSGENGSSSSIEDSATSSQAIEVQTSFVVEGLDQLPDGIEIDSLYLNVGAIYLEPLSEEDSGFTFANREPFPLRFGLEAEEVLVGPEMTLPFGGEFVVSVQLEPRYLGQTRPTVELAGTVTRFTTDDEDDAQPMPLPWREAQPMPLPWREADPMPLPWREGQPMPLPWDEGEDKLNSDVVVVPFTYRSSQLVRFMVDDVRFDGEGTYELVLAIRLTDWIMDTVVPAVTHEDNDRARTEGGRVEGEAVLVEDVVGLEGLIGDMDASAAQRM